MANWSTTPPPRAGATDTEWHTWKQDVMSNSAQIFTQRNPWFKYHKQEIFEKLKNLINVPRVLHLSRGNSRVTFSEALDSLDYQPTHIVAKHLAGHSTHEVRLLDLADWPQRAVDVLHKTVISATDLDSWYAGSEALLEEALWTENEPVPLDFKVYWCEGKPRVIAVVNRNEGRTTFSFLDADHWLMLPWSEVFLDSGPNYWDPGKRMTNEIAERAKFAASHASRIAETVDCVDLFMGIDCYVVDDKFYLGELTPRPGVIHMPWLRSRYIKRLLCD